MVVVVVAHVVLHVAIVVDGVDAVVTLDVFENEPLESTSVRYHHYPFIDRISFTN